MRAPRDGGRRRGARRGARAHVVSTQGGSGDGDVCTDLGDNTFPSNADCETCLGPGGVDVGCDPWTHYSPGCVGGQNLGLYEDQTVASCKALCVAYGSACVGIEFGVDYGHANYKANDCQLTGPDDPPVILTPCSGYNLDFYRRPATV